MISGPSSTAYRGMRSSLATYQQAARQVLDPAKMANAGEIVQLQLAQIRFSANAAVLTQAEEMNRKIIDMFA